MAARPWADVRRQLQVALRAGAVGTLTDGQLLARFRSKDDGAELAFEALVARHGPMVLSVCRSLLNASHDVEDAFQATFLVLVRQADTIRKQDSIACWLHGVARRVALRARESARRRRKREVERVQPEGTTPDPDLSEVVASLHDEIARLPEHYRVAILLCEIAGHTHAEAAARLSCPIGTVSVRVSRAKALLKERIARRGLVASSVAIGSLLRSAAARAGGFDAVAAAAAVRAAGLPARSLAASFLKARLVAAASTLAAGLLAAGVGTVAWFPASAPAPEPVVAKAAPIVETPPPLVRKSIRPVVLNWREEPIVDVTVAPDGKTFAAVRADASVTIWDIELDRERFTYRDLAPPLDLVAFSEDGSSVAITDVSRRVTVRTVDPDRAALARTSPATDGTEPVVAAVPQCAEIPPGA